MTQSAPGSNARVNLVSAARTPIGKFGGALDSRQKAVAAIDAGRFDAEMAPVTVRDAKGRETVVSVDEVPRRDASMESLAHLRPAFALPVGEDRGAATIGIGASGAQVVATLTHELIRRGGRYGLATLCLSGGGSVAMAIGQV